MNYKYLDILKNSHSENKLWTGHNPKAWWEQVIKSECKNLPNEKLTRDQLRTLCRNKNISHPECFAAIMAWGGQNRKHGKILFSRFNEIKGIVADMRNDRIDHLQAYQAFYEIWTDKKSLGMGAAYFTKAIFFCIPESKGYIMDQWTSKSVNLICNKEIIKLQNGWVTKKNNADTYKSFCFVVENVAKKIGLSSEETEIAMFSSGGHKKAPWRKFLIKHYPELRRQIK